MAKRTAKERTTTEDLAELDSKLEALYDFCQRANIILPWAAIRGAIASIEGRADDAYEPSERGAR